MPVRVELCRVRAGARCALAAVAVAALPILRCPPPLEKANNMESPIRPADFETLLASCVAIAKDTAARFAPDVDARARFPAETVDALRRVGALSAPVPTSLGGLGCSMHELGRLCAAVAAGCGSSGMVLAMHYIQVASIARHAATVPYFEHALRALVREQHLLASITSEVGTWGDTRSSLCAVEREGERFVLNKEATTGSYCAHADAILVTCRRAADAAASDQVLVYVTPDNYQLAQTTTWDSLGMRGTCSPGFSLASRGDCAQILPVPFADIAAKTMVPYSHVLWSALWSGIAADAVARAATTVRAEARRNPGTPPMAARRLAEVSARLQTMRSNWRLVAMEFDELARRPGGDDELLNMAWALRFNNLKSACADAGPEIVHRALQIVGIAGYKNDGPLSVGRHYRDILSASLMIANERVTGKSAALLMVLKDE